MENFILWLPPHVPAHNSKHEYIFSQSCRFYFLEKNRKPGLRLREVRWLCL